MEAELPISIEYIDEGTNEINKKTDQSVFLIKKEILQTIVSLSNLSIISLENIFL